MYQIAWKFHWPEVPEYHNKEQFLCFHDHVIARKLFKTFSKDYRYAQLKVFQHQYEWVDVTDAWSK